MFLKILLYGLTIVWGGLAIFAFKNALAIIKKYRKVKEVQTSDEWLGNIRVDFNRWDEKGIKIGCFIKFPFKFIIILVFLLGTWLIFRLQSIFSLKSRKISHIFIKYYAIPIIKMMYQINQPQVINAIQTPIVITNHVNWFDIIYLSIRFYPISFVSKAEVQNATLVGTIGKGIKCIFLDRANQRARQIALEEIKNRIQSYNQKNPQAFPLIIFPEGTTSNGKSILKFKIGAFHEKAKITIISLNYSCNGFDMGMDEITPLQHIIISLCLKSKLEAKCKQMQANKDETAEEYMLRCQKQLSQMTKYPIVKAGIAQKIKLKQARFGKKQA